MTFSKTTEYALRVLVLMAQDTDKMYTSALLHDELNIPKKYLQRLLTDLSKSKLIKSIQGRSGGFIFTKKLEKIFLSDIINAVEGFSHEPTCFFGFDKCALDNPCAMHDVWVQSQEKLIQVLKTTSLKDLQKKKVTF
ncbi:MAG: Rrf2 family transcriptional regulator [Ignavibacteriaceae bacterium]|jgi:Rrf2 family protein|nr:Rrf2 family transcriptional regulator [Ignavibacteriaceae bacterium]MCU0414887.1 Rrf2 family transcriptional regulator [Ignavibacteriaceae bacterium]